MNNQLTTKQSNEAESPAFLVGAVMRGLIKVCPDPGCEAVWHNIPKSYTKCNDCGGRVMLINKDTFWSKFSNNWFQYDFETGKYFRPQKPVVQLSLDFA
jgi:hypothetical protein